LIVDYYMDYCWSIFLKKKSELKNKMSTLLTDLKIAGIDVKFIRCNDFGNNKSFFTHVEQMDTTSRLHSLAQELPNEMVRWNKSFQNSMGVLERD
jgi:hypothetical protein